MPSPIAIAADMAIDQATLNNLHIPGTTEPELVARLVAELPALLVQNWTPHFIGKTLHVSSAFCHHQPQVHWDAIALGNGRPELCDLLITLASPDSTGAMTEFALLVQAKNGDKTASASLSTLGDKKQRYMYAHWPKFHVSSNCKGPAAKCKEPGSRFNLNSFGGNAGGARYGIISTSVNPTWKVERGGATWAPSPKRGKTSVKKFADCATITVVGADTLGEVLEKMYAKTLGRMFDLTLHDPWSEVIGILLDRGLYQYTRSKLSHVKHNLGAPIFPLTAASTFVTLSGQIPPTVEWYLNDPNSQWSLLRGASEGVSSYSPNWDARIPFDITQGGRGYGVIRIVVDGKLDMDVVR